MRANRRSRRTPRVALVASVLLVGTTAAAEAVSASDDDDDFDVAVVMPSAANDLAFSQSIIDSLDRLEEADVIDEYDFSENLFVVEDAAAAIRGYAESGDYDLVIAHGSQYGGPLAEIAPDFPDVAFAWGTESDTFGLPNVSAYSASSDQGGYVMGTMAAGLAGDGTIGVVGPVEVGDAKLYVDGFVAGAEAANPDVEVGVNYTDSFSDVALAAEAATSFIDGGATVLSGTAQMTVGAIGVANERGVLWFGTQSNQTQLAPEVVVANQVYHWEVVLTDLVDGIKGGTLGGEHYDINLANEGLIIEFNPDFEVPADVMAAAEETIAALASGELETGVAAAAPGTTTATEGTAATEGTDAPAGTEAPAATEAPASTTG
jgi:basic membrane lipoprotein Med (substrate-binding protein (PBP1-ABC) superfamily)